MANTRKTFTSFVLFCFSFSFFAYFALFIYPFLRIVSNCSKVNFFGFPYLSFCKLYENTYISHNKYILAPHTPLRMRLVRHKLFKVRFNVFFGVWHAT